MTKEEQQTIYENSLLANRSGNVRDDSKLVSFLYELMRDHIPPGKLETIVRQCPPGTTAYTNGYLARYARDLAARLQ